MPTQWESLANEHILGIAPYEPGKPIEELERELGVHNAIKLASNENPLPPSDRVQKAILATLNHLNRYPDGSGFYLRQALAKKHGVSPDHVVLGNGSNELIELLVRTFLRPGDEAVVPHPSFVVRSEEHTSELQSLAYLVCRLLLEKKKRNRSQT